MPGPGFEPGLLRPQRSVLTTRRRRLPIHQQMVARKKLFLLYQTIKLGYYRETLKIFHNLE